MENIPIVIGCLVPGIYAAYTDIKRGVISDLVNIFIFFTGFIYAFVTKVYVSAFLGFSLGFIIFFLVAWVTNGALGGGDIKYAAGIGMWFGYPDIVFILIFAAMGAVVYELIRHWRLGRIRELFYERLSPYGQKLVMRFILFNKNVDLSVAQESTPIPFGPFLAASSWLMWVLNLIYKGVMY